MPVFDSELYDNLSSEKYFSIKVKHFKKYKRDWLPWPIKDVDVCFLKFNDKFYLKEYQIHAIIYGYIKEVYKTKYWEF